MIQHIKDKVIISLNSQEYIRLKEVLIDERDSYLAKKIKESDGEKVVAVVGAGHLNGIIKKIKEDEDIELSSIEFIPEAPHIAKIILC